MIFKTQKAAYDTQTMLIEKGHNGEGKHFPIMVWVEQDNMP